MMLHSGSRQLAGNGTQHVAVRDEHQLREKSKRGRRYNCLRNVEFTLRGHILEHAGSRIGQCETRRRALSTLVEGINQRCAFPAYARYDWMSLPGSRGRYRCVRSMASDLAVVVHAAEAAGAEFAAGWRARMLCLERGLAQRPAT